MGYRKRWKAWEAVRDTPLFPPELVDKVMAFRDDQTAYFTKLLRDRYGWEWGSTGFIMPGPEERAMIRGRVNRAANDTLRNRP
jgi:hypothetical protein